jgi:hypothetical protein
MSTTLVLTRSIRTKSTSRRARFLVVGSFFVDSSAIEPKKLVERRRGRKTAAEIRAAWSAARAPRRP